METGSYLWSWQLAAQPSDRPSSSATNGIDGVGDVEVNEVRIVAVAEAFADRQKTGRDDLLGKLLGRQRALFPVLPGQDVAGNLLANKNIEPLVCIQ